MIAIMEKAVLSPAGIQRRIYRRRLTFPSSSCSRSWRPNALPPDRLLPAGTTATMLLCCFRTSVSGLLTTFLNLDAITSITGSGDDDHVKSQFKPDMMRACPEW